MEASLDWGPIIDRLGPKLYRYFASRFDEVSADDLTQETLVRLVSKFNSGDYDQQKGSLDMWAFGIARFVRLEEIKKKTRTTTKQSSYFDVEDEVSALEFHEQQSELKHLRESIGSLQEPQQEIILLMVDKEMNMQDIARHLKMPLGTIKSHIHRAKKNLSVLLSKTAGGPRGRQI